MKKNITELFGIEKPIVQGGLASLAYAELAAAVSNAGGLGQVTALTLPTPDALRQEIQKTKKLTSKPFGVNFAIGNHGINYEAFVKVAVEEEVQVVSITGGNPAPVMELLRGAPCKVIILTAGVRQAIKAQELGADAVIVVGQEGGGHLGRDDLSTMVLTPRVADSVSIPVIASGGIGDGRGYAAAMALGAQGIEMGTRFINTVECVHAADSYKEKILAAKENETVVIKRSIGGPARVLHNDFTDEILAIEAETPTYEALKNHISGEANTRMIYDGREDGIAYAGQVVGLIHDIPTVSELLQRMTVEKDEIFARLSGK